MAFITRNFCWFYYALFILSVTTLFGQEPTTHFYQMEQGLPNTLVKTTICDGQGFVWLGTDNGVIRFDGKHFVSFQNALPSPYIKAFYETRDRRLFVVHDGGVHEILRSNDSTIFRALKIAAKDVADTTWGYPKSFFEDAEGDWWISESSSLVRVRKGKTFQRYSFSTKTIAQSFSRSFILLETAQSGLIALSQTGYLYRYSPANDAFEEIPCSESLKTISAFIAQDKERFLIGTYRGVYELTLPHFSVNRSSSPQTANVRQILELPDVSSLWLAPDGSLYIGTWNKGLYRVEHPRSSFQSVKVNSLQSSVINGFHINPQGTVFLGADDGFAIIQRLFFQSLSLPYKRSYIQAIVGTNDGSTVYTTEGSGVTEIRSLDSGRFLTKRLTDLGIEGGSMSSILSLALTKQRLWLGMQNGQIMYWDVAKRRNQPFALPFASLDMHSIYYMTSDRNDNVWFCRGDNSSQLFCISGDTPKLRVYGQNEGIRSKPIVCKDLRHGLYVGARGNQSYLYRYNRMSDTFENVSLRCDGIPSGVEIGVNDLSSSHDGSMLLLATNYGLLEVRCSESGKPESVRLVHVIHPATLDTVQSIKSVATTKDGAIWLGTDIGVIRRQNEKTVHFNLDAGLPGASCALRALYCDKNNALWVGTSAGLAQSFATYMSRKTPLPMQIQVRLDGLRIPSLERLGAVPYHSALEAEFVSLNYPGDKTVYQSRIVGVQEQWSLPTPSNSVAFFQLPNGSYSIEVRALRPGGYEWSEPLRIPITVEKPWFLQWYNIAATLAVFLLTVWGMTYFNTRRLARLKTRRLERQSEELAKLVEQRTFEVQEQATQIQIANIELHEKNIEITAAHTQTQQLLSNVNDSIRYAKRIQDAMLPSTETLNRLLPEHFIFFRPKDVVSGDFYWCRQVQGLVFVAAVDCTGHGVPGAFMSLIGNSLLNDITQRLLDPHPDTILNTLHHELQTVLRQKETNNDDGMDICLCMIDLDTRIVEFAGAMNPLYAVVEGELREFKGTPEELGGREERSPVYARHVLDVSNVPQGVTMLYLTTDGYKDQYNAEKQRFMPKRLRPLLTEIAAKPLQEQPRLLAAAIDAHRGETPQVDDMLILGVRL
ncbi:MAG: hypothetical protein EAZ92_00305 [Candidatus Kapaibacterium sp.]|nr:MAG: hypothetical protein EAZ92_00305 [Candidatus Kapabacteria bacterium]